MSKITSIKGLLFKNTSTGQTILKNSFWLFIGELINKGLLFLIIILIARFFGASGLGDFTFAISIATFFLIFADFGLSTLTIREISRNKSLANNYINNVAIIKLLLSFITISLIYIATLYMGKSPEINSLIYIFGFYVIINSFNEFLKSFFRAFEKMEYEAYSKIIQGISLFIIVLYILLTKGSLVLVAFSYVISAIISLVFILILISKRLFKININYDFSQWKSILRNSWPFALSIIFSSIYFNIDSVLISFLRNNTELGIYAVAYSIIAAFYVLPNILANAYFPKLSIYHAEKSDKIHIILKTFVKKITIIVLPIGILLLFLSPVFIPLLYGNEFIDSIFILQILIVALVFKFYSFPFGFLLSAIKKQKTRVGIQAITASFNIITNLIFIPLFGILGAAITTIMSEFLLVCLYYSKSKKYLNQL